MATPMNSSGLPALMVPDNDALKETKKFDAADGQQHPNALHGDSNAVAKASEADSDKNQADLIEEQQNRQRNQDKITESPKKQNGLKPPRSRESKKSPDGSTDPEHAQSFRENLERGVPIESGKRTLFGFGLSDDQEDALYQYISNKSTKRPPGYESDRQALADCWGSPEPEPNADPQEPEEPTRLVLEQTLSEVEDEELEPMVSGEENEVDAASTESLYEGEGGVDLGSRSPGGVDAKLGEDIGNRCENEAEADASDPTPIDDDLTDRALIMQKVKECYGLDVRTSLERVMRKDQEQAQSSRSCTTIMPKVVGSPRASEVSDEDGISNLWEDECMRYLERAPEFRARLQYEVRVILISPAFRFAGRTVTAFSRLYEKKFGRTVDTAGFSTAARLCRSMPHVVQRTLLIDEGKLRLVDTPKNHRIVAGIRSGLRRIIYDILRTHPGIALGAIEALSEHVVGQPLHEVLIDHGYQSTNASVECLLRDMPDIVFLDDRAAQTRLYLCSGAEDPALTDGILIPMTRICPDTRESIKMKSPSCCSSEVQNADGDVADLQLTKSPPGPRKGPNGMAPEELSDLRVLCAAESSSPYRDASLYSIEDMSPHVRLRFRLLLALHDDGYGIKVQDLPGVYERMFGVPLDLPSLGMDSLQELIATWQEDVLLVKSSAPGWVFPINTLENNRILNTITSGLRSAVFAILLARYPEGLQPLELVECLEETLSGKLWEILSSNGYIFKDMSKTGAALSKGGTEFQLAECPELRLLMKDMEDFVRLGSQEDGVLIVKLRDGEFPLLDLLDCEVSEDTTSGNDNSDVIPVPDIKSPQPLTASKPVIEALLSDDDEFASPSSSPVPVSEFTVATQYGPPPSLKLQQETRIILGSSEYMENGLTVDEFCTIYRERTGKSLQLGEFKSTESLLHAMPDVVSFDVGTDTNDQMITLVQSRRNMRILSVAKVGLRQVLFWALLKNPGGIWAELLEGWYLDFAGWPLSSALASHGYEKSRRAPLQPVWEFLQDMADLLEADTEDPKLHVWGGLYEDPTHADALLLGMSVESIQYDPMNEDMKNSRWHSQSMIAKAASHLRNKVDLESASNDEKKSVVSSGEEVSADSADKIGNVDDSDGAGSREEPGCPVLKCLATLDANEENCPKKNLVESMLNTPPTLCQ